MSHPAFMPFNIYLDEDGLSWNNIKDVLKQFFVSRSHFHLVNLIFSQFIHLVNLHFVVELVKVLIVELVKVPIVELVKVPVVEQVKVPKLN